MAEEDRSLETLLNRATNPANRDEDWEHILAFCDQVNKEIEGSQIAVKLLAHKLQSPQEREALYALTTLEGCVKNCGKKFHQEIGKFRFLNEIIKVVSPKYLGKATTEKVKRRCIELIYSWSRGLPQEAKILDAYKMLKQQGVVKEDPTYIDKTLDTFPPPQPREKNAIFEDDDKANLLQKLLRSKNPQDLQAANRLIKNMVKQDTERMDKISRRINQLQEIDNNVKLLNEMLAHYTKQNSSQSDRDMMKELYDTLEKLRPNLFRLASDVDEKDNTGIAAIDLGLGEHQINGLLSILNIPTVSHCMIDSRIREVGDVIESVADQSMEEWTEREKEMTRESDGNDNVTVSVDAAWQRRGSGRSYDSLTGHCSMIGSKTGKVINYKWRSKACRICQRAETSGNIPRVHKCNKNFTGSAKAMEPDMVVDMVKESRSKGANITAIIGDEDTTTIARLRAKVDPTIVKLSDCNHMKKPIRNRLYELKNKHSTLSPKVISYIMKCFNYLIAQGKGQPKKIEENLHALSKHPFGDHSSCSTDWCRFIADPSIKYKSLPYGKPLQDKALQESLTTSFQKYILNSEKLANLGSTQSNESFNKSVAANAPKNRFYGGDRSLAYRVAAAVAQKNTGHRYTVDVNVSSGLSPGLYTRKLATLRDIQARMRKAVAITTEAKLRRIALKASRNQSSSTFEVREGVCYQSNTMIDTATEDSDEKILEIPAPKNKPVENDSKPDVSTMTHIYFDIEATGLADILTTNDDAMRVLASYKKIVEGSTSDESNLAFLRAGAGNLSSLLDLNEPSSPAKPDTSTAPSTDILDEELLALGLGDSKTDDPNKSTTLLGDLDDIFSAVTQQNTVPASQTGLQTTNIFSMPSMQGGTFQSQPLNQFNTGQPTQLSTQQVQRPPQYNNQAFSQPQQPSQGWSFQGTQSVAPSQQNKTAQQSTTTTSMGDIDLLGQSLMQQSLPKEYIKPIIPPPEKKTLNQMSTKTTDGPLLATVSPFTTSQTTVTLSSPVISSTTATPVTTPKQGEVQPLNDVFVSIESVQPGTSPPINAYDKNGMKIVIHIAKNRPREDVHVMVVSVMSTNTSAVKNFSFQAAVPKAMKVKLQPPSATDLPLYNPILPPAAITQIMLLANPQNERIRLKYKITYSLDSESRSDVGEVDNFVFS